MRLHVLHHREHRRLDLPDGTYVVGRDSACEIHIPVDSVSRRHAEIIVNGDRWRVRDLDSLNGTLMHDVPVPTEGADVPPGSRVEVGPATFYDDSGGIAGPDALGSDSNAERTHPFSVEEPYDRIVHRRVARHLPAFFELVGSTSESTELGEAVCDLVRSLLEVDRVIGIRRSEPGGPLDQIFAAWPDQDGDVEDLGLSRGIVDSVIESRSTIVIPNVGQHFETEGHESCEGISTAIAAPLFDGQSLWGILYADCRNPGVRYRLEDEQMIAAVASAAAIKLRDIQYEWDLQHAAINQRELLPRRHPELSNYDFDAELIPCKAVGGDFYWWRTLSDGRVRIALGDVAGKGVPAAICTGAAIAHLQDLAGSPGDLTTILPVINSRLYENLEEAEYTTLLIADLDPGTGHIALVNAGHPPPWIVRSNADLEVVESRGLPVGLLPGPAEGAGRELAGALPSFQCSQRQCDLNPGDLMVIFSDGFPEAHADPAHQMEEKPLQELVCELRDEPLETIRRRLYERIREHVQPEGLSDDATLILIRRHGS